MQLLENGKQQFIDQNGAPLVGGQVFFYLPATLTPAPTYQDQAGLIPNTNPILLDSNGQAIIWGTGSYRQIVKNQFGQTIWDQIVASPLSSLSSSSGAQAIGYSNSTLDVLLKSNLGRVVNSIAALRGTDKTAYTEAFVTGYYAQGDGGGGAYYYDSTDTTSTDDGWSVIVASDGGRWKLLRKNTQTTTTATDVSFRAIERYTSHSGGTAGFVDSALRVYESVGAGVVNYEWGILSVMDNGATAGQNVAVYGQGNKLNTGPTWGGVFEAHDRTGNANPTAGLIGIEVDVFANGGDSNSSRIGVDVVSGFGVGSTNAPTVYAGLRVGPVNGVSTNATFTNGILLNNASVTNAINLKIGNGNYGILMTGTVQVGIDTSGITLGTTFALRMGAGQYIAFDSIGTVKMGESAGVLSVSGGYVNFANGFGISSSGNIATTATAGVAAALPATPAGYIIVKIDGTNFKIPYYGN